MKVVSTEYNPLSHYPISEGFQNSSSKLVLEMNYVNILHTYHNVIGAIRGLEEPDRYVLMGSSRSSLETNGTDVLGGTAAMMEIAKIFGNLKKNKGKSKNTKYIVRLTALGYAGIMQAIIVIRNFELEIFGLIL